MLSQRFIVAVFDTSLPVYEFIKFLGYSRLFFCRLHSDFLDRLLIAQLLSCGFDAIQQSRVVVKTPRWKLAALESRPPASNLGVVSSFGDHMQGQVPHCGRTCRCTLLINVFFFLITTPRIALVQLNNATRIDGFITSVKFP
jgi:hypothetical protein